MVAWLALVPLLLAAPELGVVERAAKTAAKEFVAADIPQVATLKTGDLIFHTSTSNQALAIATATASPLTHVGMIRVHNGKAFVIEASAKVQVVGLKAFIARGRLSRFLILRDPTLSDVEREKMWRGAKTLVGRPYDIYFTYDRASVYCSELIWRAYAAIKKTPADDEEVGELFVNNPAVDALMAKRWRRHPACRSAKINSLEKCIPVARKSRIITPAKIADDPRYTTVTTNYPPPWG